MLFGDRSRRSSSASLSSVELDKTKDPNIQWTYRDIVHAQVFHELARVILGGLARSRANLRIPFGSPVNLP